MATPAFDKPTLYALLAFCMAGAFIGDLLVHPGVAVWILYLVPLALCLLNWRLNAPLVVAGAATVLVAAGYLHFRESSAVVHQLMLTNRCFGLFTIWTLALIGRQFIANKIKVANQDWIKAGLNGLSQRVQGEQRAADLGRSVLSYLAEYVGAQVGALYAADAAGGFARCAGFALTDESSANASVFKLGEGLVGQAAMDARIMVVDDVPENYVSVRSGVGQARPRSIVLLPTRADGEVNGVVELGFFAAGSEIARQLLETAAETIGIALRSARYRAEQADLLEETQRQAEELQSQQEELRETNEELEEANARLQEQTQALELQKASLLSTERALRDKASELERASRYKSEFLANMSHELRTPLNSSLILAKLLTENKTGNLTAEQLRYADSISGAGHDLLALINDILDLAKIEAGRIDLNVERVVIGRMLEELRSRFEPLAAQKALLLSVAIEPGCPDALETDPQRLQQILTNLISNALKFTERGSVRLLAGGKDAGRVALTVEDTGIGIPSEQHEMIFEAFRQADGTTNRRFGGTGLGLSISRELATLLGGEIQLTSSPGKGSTFTLLLPARAAVSTVRDRPAPATKASVGVMPGARLIEDDRDTIRDPNRIILVIEDDPRFAAILRDLARERGFSCIVAPSADDGLTLAREHGPTAVVLDIGLPDQSGMAVLESLKRDPSLRHVPIQVVSMHDYERAARERGAIGYVLKPTKREELESAFQLLEQRLSRTVKAVLVVEDDDLQRDAITELLSADGVEVVPVATAGDALERLHDATFDCVVLDLMLLEVSGFDLLDRMSADPTCAFPPVIIYTARTLNTDEEQRLRRVSKSVIVKGARSPERLLEEVTLFIHQVEADLPLDKQKMLRAARDRDAAFEGRRILLVEDDVRNVFALTSLLEPKGAAVDVARNGKEALARLGAGGTPDIVLMDVMMPEMDGLEATAEIRNDERWRTLPIIALTAKAMPDDRQRCLAAGANDYVAKPIDGEKLMSLLRVWMPR